MGRSLALVIAALLAGTSLAHGEEDRVKPISDPLARAECSECHMAYPAGFLPAASWRKIIGDMDHHFGNNAHIEPETQAHVLDYYVKNAGSGNGLSSVNPPLRITQLPWFIQHHRYALSAETKKSVGSMLNCQGCHAKAAQGIFEQN